MKRKNPATTATKTELVNQRNGLLEECDRLRKYVAGIRTKLVDLRVELQRNEAYGACQAAMLYDVALALGYTHEEADIIAPESTQVCWAEKREKVRRYERIP